MECTIAPNKGFEDFCKAEIKQILKKNAKLSKECFKLKLTEKDIEKLGSMKTAKNIFIGEGQEKKLIASDKRQYLVKNNPPNLGPSLAHCMVLFSGYKPKDVLLDPLCCGSKIVIEAWLLGKGKSIFGIDSYTGNIEDSKLNIQAAGADISLSCRSIDWLDYLFEPKSVDKIITYMPSGSSSSTDALYRELFYQAKYCLKKNGIIVVASKRQEAIEKYAELFEFVIDDKRESDLGKVFKIKFA
ncbi:hypothetical protein KY311_04415 [Candidatus Woesearchaeota archaeon]|nr:hypothetical protein [Candidatus Woesearchaeota archaeon]